MITLLIIVIKLGLCQNLYLDKAIYQGIVSAACTRLLNYEGTLGCAGEYSGTIGALISISTQDDLNSFFNSNGKQNYALVLPQKLFISPNFEKLEQSDRIKGIVLTKDDPPSEYSLESKTPNLQYGLYAKEQTPYQWNPRGLDLLSKSSSKPIFQIMSLRDFNSSQALSEAINYNKALGYSRHPLYHMEFRSNMFAIDNAETCLRRKYCDPIGEKSVWSTFSNSISSDDNKPVIFLTSKFDSNSLFRDLSFGHSQIAGSLVVLAVADAFSRSKTTIGALPKHIIFSLFGAESFGHSGSQRFVQDISTKDFQCKSKDNQFCGWNSGSGCSEPCYETLDFQKINFENIGIFVLIETVIDIDTVGLLHKAIGENVDLFIHIDQINSKSTNLINAFEGKTAAKGFNGTADITVNLKAASDQITNNRLPPSPAMAFLQKKGSISSIVISDYQNEYSNPYFNSEYDVLEDWGSKRISLLCGLATTIAQKVFSLASGVAAPLEITADCNTISNLIQCVTKDYNCIILQSLMKDVVFPTKSVSYSSVFSFGKSTRSMPLLFSAFLANATAINRKNSCRFSSECADDKNICIQNQCVESMTRFHAAYGTGLEFNYHSGLFEVKDKTKASFVESSWDATQIRIFKIADGAIHFVELIIGILITVAASGVILYWKSIFK